MLTEDANADLVGYEMVWAGDPPTRWRVDGTNATCGSNYVTLTRVEPAGIIKEFRVQNAGVVRRRKQIEEEDGA